MSENKNSLQVPEIGNSSRDQTYRHSLQPKGSTEGPILRHTQSQNYGAKKKKVKVPPIPEMDGELNETVEIVNEQVKEKRQRHSKGSRRSSQASSRLGIDNAGFEVEDGGLRITRGTSAGSSARSSTRAPSERSLTLREQYWCCAKWTPCERALFAVVGVLIFIILILVIVVAIVATSNNKSKENLNFLSVFDMNNY